MRKIGLSYQEQFSMSPEEQAKIMSEAGFSATFTGWYGDAQKELIEAFGKHNIVCETIHGPFRPINEFWLDCEVGEKIYHDFSKCIEDCDKYDIPTLVLHMSSGMTPPPITEIGIQRIEKLIEQAAKKNITLAFENLRKLFNLAWAFETYRDCDTIKFCWDNGHQYCFTPNIDFMPMFGKKTGCLHLHDNYQILNQDDHLLPFDGTIDMQGVANRIKDSGFDGTLMLEVFPGKHEKYLNMSEEEYIFKAGESAKRLASLVE